MNPLSKYTKIPSVYVKLCTNNVYEYPKEVVENSFSEMGVCARSARDELMFNNPDALLNGEAVIEVIKNNVPNIKDPSKLFVRDVEQLLIAIKLATKEKTYSIESTCPNCKKHGAFERDLQMLLDGSRILTEIPTVILDDLGLVIKLRPLYWHESTKFGQEMFQCHKHAQSLEKIELTDEEKLTEFTKIFDKMTELNFDSMLSNILSIETPEAETTNKEHIKEWLSVQPSYILGKIKEGTDKFDEIGIEHSIDAVCSECSHEWKIEGLYYDPSDFFVRNFSSRNQKKSDNS